MMTMTNARIAYLYDLMDAAYDAAAIHDHAKALGHMPHQARAATPTAGHDGLLPIDRQIESPMPRPSGFVVTKGSKRRSATAGSRAAPVSSTEISTVPG